MDDSRICMICKHENLPETSYCEACGAYFRISQTIRMDDLWPKELLRRRALELTPPPPGTFALDLIGRSDPLLVEAKDRIVLGRYIRGHTSPTVDLTPYHAGLLGVSRQHAAVGIQDGKYYVEDLKSTNGTWVNEERIPPNDTRNLRSGDQIRLGQFIFFIRFST